MNWFQRVRRVFAGLWMLLCAVIMFVDLENGYLIVTAILSLSLFFSGIRQLLYYLTMARYMVGGRRMLYMGMIRFDLGMFTATLSDIPRLYVLLYLLAIHAFSGLVDVLRANEARQLKAASWRLHMMRGIINLLLAFACCVFIRTVQVVVYLYGAGLFYSACSRIASAFRKTAIVYIQ